MTMDEKRQRPPPPAWLRPAIDYGPVVAFFATYFAADLFTATWVLLGVTALGLGLSLWLERRVPVVPLVTAVVVGIFGGLTLVLREETFIKMKPTIVQALLAAALLGGLVFRRSLLRPMLGKTLRLPDAAWRMLTLRFGLFFAGMAVLNEIVWRTQTTDLWVNFKLFGILGLTFGFTLLQMPYLKRHALPPEEQGDP
jgi:intracellular septation protein